MNQGPSFSICIPNYNYERYLGRTIESVLAQTYQNFEIIIADNASTDRSVEVAKRYASDRVRVIENNYNIGFAPNLDRATSSAKNDYMILLSSDDLMRPDALETYAHLIMSLGDRADRCVLTSAVDVIDSDDGLVAVHYRAPGEMFYQEITLEKSSTVQWQSLPVEHYDGSAVLREALRTKNSPASFLATCYPRKMYEKIEGYNNGFRMSPDGQFLYKLLSVVDSELVYVPRRLFAYRVHNHGQLQAAHASGAMKYQTDAYLHTLEFPADVLDRIGVSRKDLVGTFVEKALMDRGLQAMAAKNRERALKCLAFGFATYPKDTLTQPKTYALAGLLAMGPAGGWVAERLYKRHRGRKAAG